MKKNIYYFSVILAGILWGLTGLLSRTLYAAGMEAGNVSAVRVIGATIGFVLWNAFSDRSAFHIQAKHIPLLFCTGIISKFGSTFFYAQSQQLCSLAVSGILLYTAPAIVVVLSALLWKEKITKEKFAALVLTLLGCALVTGLFSGEQSATAIGIAFGFASGLTYALYTVFSHYALKTYSARALTLWSFLFGSIGSFCTMNPSNITQTLAKPGMLFYAIGIALLCTLLPNFLYTLGLAHIESGRASIIVSLDPAVSALLGILLFFIGKLGFISVMFIGFGFCILAVSTTNILTMYCIAMVFLVLGVFALCQEYSNILRSLLLIFSGIVSLLFPMLWGFPDVLPAVVGMTVLTTVLALYMAVSSISDKPKLPVF